jgi:hypothetical protein
VACASRDRLAYLYFIQAGDDGPIKIGAADDPEFRRKTLAAGSPYDLRLLAVIPQVPGLLESLLHKRFYHLAIRREWFRPESELLEFIRVNGEPFGLTRPPRPPAPPYPDQVREGAARVIALHGGRSSYAYMEAILSRLARDGIELGSLSELASHAIDELAKRLGVDAEKFR